MYRNVLVTGGSGFVGKALKRYRPDWDYLSSMDCDLTDKRSVAELFSNRKPDAVIHLAAKVGGIKENSTNQSLFFYINNMINFNVQHEAPNSGVKRVLSSLSTCCFPDTNSRYPLTEEDILKAEPAETNYCYAYAKRNLYVQSKWCSKEYSVCYNTFTPCNVYGPHDNFDIDTGHFVSGMIRKFYHAKDGDTIEFWGTGRPLRQHIYVEDLAQIIVKLLHDHTTDFPLIVAPAENLSIKEVIDICRKVTKKKVNIRFNNHLDGQFRKDGSNKRLLGLMRDLEFTPLEAGLLETYNWYGEQL